MRVAVLTGVRVGGAGAALPTLATTQGVNVSCVIFSRGLAKDQATILRRKLRKVWKIGLVGAIQGVRLRKWFRHADAQDILLAASRLNIPVVDVDRVNSEQTIEALRRFEVDLGISLGNGYIAPRVFEVPPLGMINYHGELLPEYPGALSILWPIYFGQSKTGFTIHRIDRGIDTGQILMRREFDIAFQKTLRETVRETGRRIHPHMPTAIANVVADWERYLEKSQPNGSMRSFTTPTIWQFIRMWRNNRRLYRNSIAKGK